MDSVLKSEHSLLDGTSIGRALFSSAVFADFGSDPLMPVEPSQTIRIAGENSEELRDAVRKQIPRVPGVYGMIDVLGRLIYVGKSKSLRSRLLSYFMPTNEDEKSGRIIQNAVQIAFETQPSEFAALLREQYLIRTLQPRYNVQGIPNRQKPVFICLGRSPAETFYSAAQPDPKAIAWEGPLFGSGRIRRSVEVLNRFFKLRDCSNQTKFSFTNQLRLFDPDIRPGCLRQEIGSCLGPCAHGCSRREYDEQVELAKNFLRGDTENVVEKLEYLMLQAADRKHFEQAMRLREDWKVLGWLSRRLNEHEKARQELTCIYPVQGWDGRDLWYLIRRGVIEHALVAPKGKREHTKAQREVDEWFRQDNHLGAKFQRREETLAIVSGWFRKFPDQRKTLVKVGT